MSNPSQSPPPSRALISRGETIARRTAVALTTLLLILFLLSGCCTLLVSTPQRAQGGWSAVGLSQGAAFVAYTLDASKGRHPGRTFTLHATPGWSVSQWMPRAIRSPAGQQLIVPLWIPGIVTFTAAVILIRRARRVARWLATGDCPRCGYIRAHLSPTAPCPECATTPAPVTSAERA